MPGLPQGGKQPHQRMIDPWSPDLWSPDLIPGHLIYLWSSDLSLVI